MSKKHLYVALTRTTNLENIAILKPNDKLFSLENQGHLDINDNSNFLFELEEILK